MRGARQHDGQGAGERRIIPADAGSTCPPAWPSPRPWDHPRGCGEHYGIRINHMSYGGSSPRMRGALWSDVIVTSKGRIIPADAGSTTPTQSIQLSQADHPRGCGEHRQERPERDPGADHPRGCGEHAQMTEYENEWQGSSPRMRGAHHDSESDRLESGIIPADAGSTERIDGLEAVYEDHPRGCGEHN